VTLKETELGRVGASASGMELFCIEIEVEMI
jgi:hypothetical protein